MSAYEIPNLRFSAESNAAVARRRFVKLLSTEKAAVAGAGEAVVGASMNEATAAGQVLEIADGIVMVEAGAAVNAGAEVQSDAAGKAITLAAGIKAGVAVTTAAGAGELISVKIS